jgi:hypothetical protein
MTVFQLIILPGLLTGAFLLGVLWLLAKITRMKLAMMKAAKAADEVSPALLREQGAVISDVIYELEANKLSYTGFPVELKDRLIDVHGKWAVRRKGIT